MRKALLSVALVLAVFCGAGLVLQGCKGRHGKPIPTNVSFPVHSISGNVIIVNFSGIGAPKAPAHAILHLWGTWCGPCRQELPSFLEFAKQYAYNDVAISAVSVDDTPEDVKRFIKSIGWQQAGNPSVFIGPLQYGRGHDDVSIYSERIFPTTVFIGAGGKVVMRIHGTYDWNSDAAKTLMKSFLSDNLQSETRNDE